MPAALVQRLEASLRATLPMARIEPRQLPDCAGIELGLINADFPIGPLPADVMRDVVAQPAYWAFCWGSGLALAQFIVRHPHWVRGRQVLDVGSGSGVVAIAAARSGAALVTACDSDPDALAATAMNAAANGVSLKLLSDLGEFGGECDLLLMADVLYDRSNLSLLDRVAGLAPRVLIADSRIKVSPKDGFELIAECVARTVPNLGEFDEFRTVRLFFQGPLPDADPDASPVASISTGSA